MVYAAIAYYCDVCGKPYASVVDADLCQRDHARNRAVIRRFVKTVAENIDPDVTVEKIKIGEQSGLDQTSMGK